MNSERETTESSGLESSDSETDAYYYRARYYDQNAGRFLSEDPTGFDSGIDFYLYVRNNAPTWIDPFGLSVLVFDRATGTIALFDKDNGLLLTCHAGNRTTKSSKGPWPLGVYPFAYHNNHPADPNGPYGSYGIDVFRVPGRTGMGVHSGRANKGGADAHTNGCIRTEDDCRKNMQDLTATDPITRIAVI